MKDKNKVEAKNKVKGKNKVKDKNVSSSLIGFIIFIIIILVVIAIYLVISVRAENHALINNKQEDKQSNPEDILTDEEKKLVSNNINYLKEQFPYADIKFSRHYERVTSCKCIHHWIIDGHCTEYDCERVDGEYIYDYDVCISFKCFNAIKYHAYNNEWSISERLVELSNIVTILEENNLKYIVVNDDGRFEIYVNKKGEIGNFLAAFDEIYQYIVSLNLNASSDEKWFKSNSHRELYVISDSFFEYILKEVTQYKISKNHREYSSFSLSQFRYHKYGFVEWKWLEKKELGTDMFDCGGSEYLDIAYELDEGPVIRCIGFTKDEK